MAPSSRIAVVTGANKGIGFAIVRQLALTYPKSPLRSGPLTIYLTARSKERGEAAVQALQDDAALRDAKVLVRDGGDTKIEFAMLDVGDKSSVDAFCASLSDRHGDGVDFVINNAGVALEGFDSAVVEQTLRINYYGATHLTETILPRIRPNGRMVNVASQSGLLSNYSGSIREEFLRASQSDVKAVDVIVDKFVKAVDENRVEEAGFPRRAYGVSKASCIAMTKVIGMLEKRNDRSVLVNACCPGYVNTDMTKGRGVKTPDEGARTPVMLALADIGGTTGEFWKDEKITQW